MIIVTQKQILAEFEKKYKKELLNPFLEDLQDLLSGEEITNRIPREIADKIAELFEGHTEMFEKMLLDYGGTAEELGFHSS